MGISAARQRGSVNRPFRTNQLGINRHKVFGKLWKNDSTSEEARAVREGKDSVREAVVIRRGAGTAAAEDTVGDRASIAAISANESRSRAAASL